ncbi:2-dehydropantoate 2-reductase [Alcanivorax hongdengensis A-11-3]|uniref:2-dehydropantoate 2-reductase n=1 Tax=Alcanivorax hongdengensis A-11-3 TaxID=1177179 RepID=L0WDA0_9GAMM|nr:2-dehydropantoate 2-reductase [Alcanivorax hongdengensis]EKF74956.1 2-dehydropantoate 2-reductase [Alcanivorax hongdengensis A-11-3]
MSDQPHVLIVGAGAIGSFYGAILKRAGCRVSVVLRSDYDAVKGHGFRFESVLGELSWMPDHIYRDDDVPQETPDYVLLCVKVLPGVDRAALVRPWLGDETVIVLIENGLDIERELAVAFPTHALISCLAFIAVSRIGPGQIHHQAYGQLVMGNFPTGFDAHCQQLAGRLRDGGIEVNETEAVVGERWRKCVWNAPFNPLSVLADGADTLTILNAPGGEALVRAMMQEVMAVAKADGYPLPAELVDKNIAGTRAMGAYKNSMALDYLHGRPIELDAILGNAVAIAERLAVPVPHLNTVLTALRIRQQ